MTHNLSINEIKDILCHVMDKQKSINDLKREWHTQAINKWSDRIHFKNIIAKKAGMKLAIQVRSGHILRD
jgi:hypothetical protein